jgi:hypothetical protein
MVFLPFPAQLRLWNRGSGRGEEPGGATALRLIQIRLAVLSVEKTLPAVKIKSGKKGQL